MVILFEKILFTLLGIILGTVLGSFIKALADRSLSKRSFGGRSVCVRCKRILKWYDLIPLVSYTLLKGRCRYCDTKIGIEYLLVEAASGVLIGTLFYLSLPDFPGLAGSYRLVVFTLDLLFKIFIVTVLSIITLTDLKKTLIPDRVMLPAILIGFVYLLASSIYKVYYLYYFLSQNPIGRFLLPPHSDYFLRHALTTAQPLTEGVTMGFVLGLFFFSLIVITKGRGMGGGDFKLGIFIGLALGFPGAVLALLLAFLSGSLVGIALLLAGRKKLGQTIPFGPFLSLGSITAVFWGEKILNWYLGLKI